jgi:hypothetical protein
MGRHEIDLKDQFAYAKERGVQCYASQTFRFLRMAHSVPTYGEGRGRNSTVQFSGAKPFIRRVQMGSSELELSIAEGNVNLISEVCKKIKTEGEEVIGDDEVIMGYCSKGREVEEVISILEGLAFSFHNPKPTLRRYVDLKKYVRRSDNSRELCKDIPLAQDPYLISAFLKYWKAAYEDDIRCQNEMGLDWKRKPPPKFNIAVKFGKIADDGPPFDFPLMNRAINAEGHMVSGWGSRAYGGNHMDEWFDHDRPHSELPSVRGEGDPGLVLVHVVSRKARGPAGKGEEYSFDRPTIALSIPKGGPSILSVTAGD